MLPGTARWRALCLEYLYCEEHGALGAVRGWQRRAAWGLLLGARSREEDAHGRRAQAARLSAVLAAAAALGVRGISEASQERRSRPGTWQEDAERRPSTPCPDLWGSPRALAGRPGWARGSRPPPGAAEQPGHRGPAECRSRRRGENLCQWPCPGAEPSAKLSTRGLSCAGSGPGPHSPSARSSQRAPDKMARPVRGALGAPRRSPCPLLLWLLLLLLRLEPATAEAGPRAPCAAACTCAGDSLDCGGRGLAALPRDLPAWTRSL